MKPDRLVQKMIVAGAQANQAAILAALSDLRPDDFDELYLNRVYALKFVETLPFVAVLRFVRALAAAEKVRLCPYPGSVSILISVYIHAHRRSDGERAALADWIVTHHGNPYTPFNLCSTRDKWLMAREGARSPLETLRRAEAWITHEDHEAARREKRHAVHDAINQLPKGNAPASPELRDRMLAEMERRILEE